MSQARYYPSPSLTLSAIGSNGLPIPSTSLLVAGSDGTNLRPLLTDSSGHLIIDGTTTGGATAANQVLEIAQLTGIHSDTTAVNGKLPASLGSKLSSASLSIVLASDGTLPLPSGAATAANQATEIASLASIDTKTPALGQALAASSVPVVLTAAQLTTLTPLSTVTVTQATGTNLHTVIDNFPATQPVSGTVAATQSGTWNITNISGTVSLPTGAATETTLAAINTKTPALGQAVMASSVPVVLASNQSTIPTNQAQINGVTQLAGNGVTGTGSQRVTIASDNTAFPTKVSDGTNTAVVKAASTAPVAADAALVVTMSPNAPAAKAVAGRSLANAPVAPVDYTSTPVTSAAYVQLVASTTSATNLVEIFDSSGQTLYFAVGAAASEVNQFVITPGGNGPVSLAIPAGSRLSVKATGTSATAGILVVNLYT